MSKQLHHRRPHIPILEKRNLEDDLTRLNRMLDEIGQRDGIKNLQLSPVGTAALDYCSGARVCFEYVRAKEMFYIYTPLGRIPPTPEQRVIVLDVMMESNFLRLRTRHGDFAMARHIDQLVYQVGLAVSGLDMQSLDNAISELLEQRDECIHLLNTWKPADVTATGRYRSSDTKALIARMTSEVNG